MTVRCALTQTVNAYEDMPESPAELGRLKGKLDAVRAANLAHHARLVRAAARKGAQAVCLGELFPGPYFALGKDPVWFDFAEDAVTGPSVAAMRDVALECGVLIIAPIYELERRRRYNTAVVIDRDGRILGRYRKVHIPCGANEQGSFHETYYYDPSKGLRQPESPSVRGHNPYFPAFATSIGTIGVAICYDRHFEGVVSALAGAGAQIVFCPAVTFGEKSRRLWELEFPVDACRHRLFIGGSNRLGREKPWNQEFFGGSYFAGPDGERLPDLSDEAQLAISDLDLDGLGRQDPSGWDLRRDARPAIY
ncbi:MAG: acyltransferase [Elusimicrobia bacterium]|nr:acyltransferase [Elusimicrobiota bacterium]